MTPATKIRLLIDNTWNKVWSVIKDHTFTVSVKNQIEIPEIEFPEVKFPEIPEQIDTRTELKEIVKTILEQTKELKSSSDTSATKEQLLNILGEILIVLSSEKEDETPDLVAEIRALGGSLDKVATNIPKTDLKPIQTQIGALNELLKSIDLTKYTRYGDWRVFINEKQFKQLVSSLSVSVSAAGGGGNIRIPSGDVSSSNPLPVSASSLPLPTGAATEAKQLADDHNVQVSNQLVPEKYDYIGLGYTGSNLTTVTFKTGGSGGSTVATLTLAYTGSVLDSVTKT